MRERMQRSSCPASKRRTSERVVPTAVNFECVAIDVGRPTEFAASAAAFPPADALFLRKTSEMPGCGCTRSRPMIDLPMVERTEEVSTSTSPSAPTVKEGGRRAADAAR